MSYIEITFSNNIMENPSFLHFLAKIRVQDPVFLLQELMALPVTFTKSLPCDSLLRIQCLWVCLPSTIGWSCNSSITPNSSPHTKITSCNFRPNGPSESSKGTTQDRGPRSQSYAMIMDDKMN